MRKDIASAWLLAGMMAGGAASPVHAQDWGTAAGVCAGALPAFEAALRKRPLAVVNEGDRTAFVTCSLRQSYLDTGTRVQLYFTNRTDAHVPVRCTLVTNHDLSAWNARFLAGELTLAPGEMYWLYWERDEELDGPTGFQAPSVSCALPPGTEINMVEYETSGFWTSSGKGGTR